MDKTSQSIYLIYFLKKQTENIVKCSMNFGSLKNPFVVLS